MAHRRVADAKLADTHNTNTKIPVRFTNTGRMSALGHRKNLDTRSGRM